jgi:hypothetical protein
VGKDTNEEKYLPYTKVLRGGCENPKTKSKIASLRGSSSLILQSNQELKSFKDELYPLGLEAQGLRVEVEGNG